MSGRPTDAGDAAITAGAGGTSIQPDASSGGAGGTSGTSDAPGGSGGVGSTGGAAGSDHRDAGDGSAMAGASGRDAAMEVGNAGAGGSDGADAMGTGGNAGAGGTVDGAAGNAGAAGAAGSSTIDAGQDAPIATGAVFSVGSFVKSGATETQIISHSLGQTPKALLLWTVGKTNETSSDGFYYGLGISDGATSVALAMSTRDAVSPTSSSRRAASKALSLVQGGETVLAEADLSSMSASEITLNWTVNDGQPYVIHYLAIGGAEVSAKLVNWQTPTTTGMKSVSGIGFQPQAVLHFHIGAGFVSAAPSSQSNGVIGMGVMNEAGAEWSVQVADATGMSTSVSTRAQRTDAAIYMYHAPSAVTNKVASFVSMDPGGFTLDFTTASSDASQVYSLALAGLKASVGTFTKSTAAEPATQAVPTAFTPSAVLLSSYQIPSQTASVRESQCSWGIGASDGIHEGSSAFVAKDGESPASTEAIDKTSKAFVKMNSPPMDAEADLSSFDPSGFTLSWTSNDPVPAQICFLALGKQ